MHSIIDLHCDLLAFLTDVPGRSPLDPRSGCSYPDLIKGNVKTQVLAIFARTSPSSSSSGEKQVELFDTLLHKHSGCFQRAETESTVRIIPAIENASSFAQEQEPLDVAIKRLEEWIQKIGKPLYIGLTWGDENRFGGGDQTKIGLKEDGKRLLDWMHQKKIALDFSHTSDPLAYDLLDWIDQNNLDIPVIASHSNFRAISPWARNLPQEIAQEIIRRKGLIGLNFFAPFIDKADPNTLVHHVEYALSLGAKKSLCFGADFFYTEHPTFLDLMQQKYGTTVAYHPQMQNASCYPYVLDLLCHNLRLSTALLADIAYHNALHFIELQS